MHFRQSRKNDSANNNDGECEKKKTNAVENFFSCFSIIENSNIITSHKLGKDSIEVIHGIR